MRIEWECSDCGKINETETGRWGAIADGRSFYDDCEMCGVELEIEIEINVSTRQ